MTPQERKLVDELFDRLASLENNPRDPEAVRAINEGLQRAPNALYPLVQTALVQDEALKRADARIRELEDELGVEPRRADEAGRLPRQHARRAARQAARLGAVGAARCAARCEPVAHHLGATGRLCRRAASAGLCAQPGYGAAPPPGSAGGSFLGTAAATAAGVVGGALLMNSFRGMFGGGHTPGRARSIPAAAQARRGVVRIHAAAILPATPGSNDIGQRRSHGGL